MTGEGNVPKAHYRGPKSNDDFIIILTDPEEAEKWQKEHKDEPDEDEDEDEVLKTLNQLVEGKKVFVTGKHGSQGELNTAPDSTLETEFDTSKAYIAQYRILKHGKIISHKSHGRQGNRNLTDGSLVYHG